MGRGEGKRRLRTLCIGGKGGAWQVVGGARCSRDNLLGSGWRAWAQYGTAAVEAGVAHWSFLVRVKNGVICQLLWPCTHAAASLRVLDM